MHTRKDKNRKLKFYPASVSTKLSVQWLIMRFYQVTILVSQRIHRIPYANTHAAKK
jgi:hypothetical protein